MSPAAVRQHLDTLSALGFVSRRKVVTRPSRPTYLYRLSDEGSRAFPKRYDVLLRYLVEVLIERHGTQDVVEVLEAAGRRLAERVRGRFASADERERWELLVDWLENEFAWQAEITEEPPGRRRITIYHCPFQDASRVHPAVCGAFLSALIRALYGEAPVDHQPAAGAPACCSLLVAEIASPR